ncbi:rhamnogalacturonan acetylesterase [Streptomyces sp. NPDC056121]|uniref:rhamnogalacturonan acetylesterase n=1 Tax=Streptomyces sp. NPDC056121 TaxID=3345718 RepID=UPI0035DDCF80
MTRIFLAGDSSVTDRPYSQAPMAGWGQALPLFLPTTHVVNAARAGASSRSFVERGRLLWIEQNLAPGDLFLVSFGLIDHKKQPGRGTSAFTDFQWYLRRYVHAARDRGAHPVLVTSHDRRVFDPHGNFRRSLGLYPQAVRELAAACTVPLIDLNHWTTEWWSRAGLDGTRGVFLSLEPGEHPHYPEGVEDRTHLRPAGAIECARFVADQLGRKGLLPQERIHHLGDRIPEDALRYLDDHTYAHVTKERVAGR